MTVSPPGPLDPARLRERVRRPSTWASAGLVLACLLAGLHAGDVQAATAQRRPEALAATLAQQRARLHAARSEVAVAEQAARGSRRRAARAALVAYLAGARGAPRLLPSGMRFACLDRSSGRCVVVADGADRTVSLVWPAYRPDWAESVGLPPGPCPGTGPPGRVRVLDDCERGWLGLPHARPEP